VKVLFLATVEIDAEAPKLLKEEVWLKGLAETIENQIKLMIVGDVTVSYRKEPKPQ
jgi:hypothetical protein